MANISNYTDGKLVLGTNGADSIYNFARYVTVDAGAGNDTITNRLSQVIIECGDDNDIVSNDDAKVTIDCGAGNDSVANAGTNASIVGGDGNDTIRHYSSDASIVGGAGDDLISLASYSQNNLIEYASGDGNDTVIGFNDTDTLSLDGGYSTQRSGDNIIITVGNGKITLVGAASLSALNIDGEEKTDDTLTLTNDDAAKQTLAAQIVTADASARTKATRIVGNALDNSILGGSGKDTLYGKDGDDFIDGGKNNDKLYGQNGDDTLHGGAGNDTLWGGAGNDLFVYSTGNDIINDYATGDKISLGANLSSATVDGANAILTVDKNTLTVTNGKGKQLTLIDAAGNEYTTTVGGLVLTNSDGATTLAAGVAEADASARTKAIKITGNALDNTILGGAGKDSLYGKDGDDYIAGGTGNDKLYGQNGNDTLWGGLGNDTLAGGTGADVFLYDTGEGKDVISGFANSDMLLITGAFTTSYDASTNAVAFKVGDGSITLKDFTATSFNVNGFRYKISGSKLVK